MPFRSRIGLALVLPVLAGGCGNSSTTGSEGSQNGAGSSTASGASGTASGGSTTSGSTGRANGAGSSTGGSSSSSSPSSTSSGSSGAASSSSGSGSSAAPAQTTSLVTSAAGAYWQTGGTLTTVTTGNATVTVNDTSTLQNWEGFGGAFNELGWKYLSMLNTSQQQMAIDLLFGSDAANFNIGRIPMGASDYAVSRYTDDEVASGTDFNLASFSINEDTKYLIPYVQAAMAVNSNIRFWASPWTPPTWMKTGPFVATTDDNATTSSNFDSGNMTNSTQILTTYAQYFVKWVQAYAQQGITISFVSPQNEPNYALHYPSCVWTSSLFDTFVGQYLGPAISAAGLSTQIMLGTMSNGNAGTDPAVVTAVMGDATSKSFIKVLGFQWNMEPMVSADKTTYSPLPIWQTEHRAGNYPFSGVMDPTPTDAFNSTMAPNDQGYGVESWQLIDEWIKAGVTSYSAWNMILDTVGLGIDTHRVWPQNALLTVNTSTKTLNITPAYYVFRHLSHFVVPGATVVGTTGGDALAFKNPDGSIVTVMYNSGAATTYILAVGGKKLQFAMPANGWATVDYVP